MTDLGGHFAAVDLNPVIVTAERAVAVDVLMLARTDEKR